MIYKHPFEFLSNPAQRRAFLALLILSSLLMGAMALLDRQLKTTAAPFGIVSFELARTQTNSQEMLQSWGPQGQIYAALSIGLDYLYLFSYSSTISLGCVFVAQRVAKRTNVFSLAGVLLAWSQGAAALLDAIENYALIRLLLGADQELWPTLAWWCAVPKFAIIASGLVYLVAGGVVISKISNSDQKDILSQ